MLVLFLGYFLLLHSSEGAAPGEVENGEYADFRSFSNSFKTFVK